MIGLSAVPNPVPISEKVGQTIIRWNTADAGPGQVYVCIDGKEELLFAGGCQGVATANWIEAGRAYEFRLYDSDRTHLLDKISVTTAIQ